MLLETTQIGDIIDAAQIKVIEPRPHEGCFAHVNANHAINVFFIQQFDLILERFIAFMNEDLTLVYKSFDGLPVLSLKYGYLILSTPVFNALPEHNILTLCSIQYPEMKINQLKRYQLPSELLDRIRADVRAFDADASTAYARFDQLDKDETNRTIFEEGLRFTLSPMHA